MSAPVGPSGPKSAAPDGSHRLILHPGRWAACRLPPDAAVPEPPLGAALWSVTRTRDETSLILPEHAVPKGAEAQSGFAALAVVGPLDFSLTGVLAGLSSALAEAAVPLLALSTFDTDWLLVPGQELDRAVAALEAAGHRVDPA